MKPNRLDGRLKRPLALALSCLALGPVVQAQDKKPEDRKVLFGEQHMHTRNSFDAFTLGVKMTWEEAYRFAIGEEIKLSTTGEKMKRRTPYDFVAITDHSEYYAVLKDLLDPSTRLRDRTSPKGSRRWKPIRRPPARRSRN